MHCFTLDERYFDFIKNGTKRIELRLNDKKRQNLKIGDTIIFSEKNNDKNKISAKVDDLFKCSNFNEILNMFNVEILADKSISKQEILNDLEQFYTKEKQQQYGVIGIKIKLLDGEHDNNE